MSGSIDAGGDAGRTTGDGVALFEIAMLPGGRGCPEFVGGTLSPSPTWRPFVRGSHLEVDDLGFTFACRHRELACAFFTYGPHFLFSRALAELTVQLQIPGRSAPVRVAYAGGAVEDAAYALFVPGDHRSVLDTDASTYVSDVSGDTGLALDQAPDFPGVPNVARIDAFIVDADATEGASLFYCVDVGALVCTAPVASAIASSGLRGIRLVPLDETYRYVKYPVFDD